MSLTAKKGEGEIFFASKFFMAEKRILCYPVLILELVDLKNNYLLNLGLMKCRINAALLV